MSLNKKDPEIKGIRSTIILEIIGRPPELLIQTLEGLIKEMGEENGVQVLNKKINEPILMKDSKEFYTTFAEVDIETQDMLYLAIVLFKYMPSHIEVVEPSLIELTNSGWSEILSELARRLHGYDEVARIMQFENSQMQEKLKRLSPKIEIKENIPEKEEVKNIDKKKNKR